LAGAFFAAVFLAALFFAGPPASRRRAFDSAIGACSAAIRSTVWPAAAAGSAPRSTSPPPAFAASSCSRDCTYWSRSGIVALAHGRGELERHLDLVAVDRLGGRDLDAFRTPDLIGPSHGLEHQQAVPLPQHPQGLPVAQRDLRDRHLPALPQRPREQNGRLRQG
jgi:hypothetical protein